MRVDVVIGVEPLLSEAQKESLLAYAECGDVEIAASFRGCSPHTIERHLAAVRHRLGVHSTGRAVHLAWKLGILTGVKRER